MPIPSSINDLDTNPNNNSPQGSEQVGPNANGYFQALGAFIKQLATGVGIAPTSDVNMGGKKLTNLGAGSITSTSTDAINGGQARGLAYKVGEVRMWHGAVANIAATWGAGWQLADGTNNTADLRDRFIVGAGSTYAAGATGGEATHVLTTSEMPSHAHSVSDPGHAHSVSDPGHAHGVSDPGHSHVVPGTFGVQGGSYSQEGTNSRLFNLVGNPGTSVSGSNVSIAGALSNISIFGAGTGIGIVANGGNAAHENRPPYFALCYIEYTGIGA